MAQKKVVPIVCFSWRRLDVRIYHDTFVERLCTALISKLEIVEKLDEGLDRKAELGGVVGGLQRELNLRSFQVQASRQ